MMISNHEQLILLLRCLGCGVWLDLTWTLLEPLRQHVIRTKPMRFLFDCVCTILSGFCVFIFSLAVSGGELRAAMLLAIGVGAVASHASIGRALRLTIRLLHRLFRALTDIRKNGFRKTAK